MKKFVYLFLFILLYSCASSYSGRQAEQQNKIFIGQSKSAFCYNNMAGGALLGESICFFSLRNRNNSYLYYLAGGNEVLSTNDGRFYLFKDVSIPIGGIPSLNVNSGNGTLASIHNSMNEATRSIKETLSTSLAQTFIHYKKQCKSIGFKENTDAFGECVLEFKKIDMQIASLEPQRRQANSSDVLNKLLIFENVLRLLSPPTTQSFSKNNFNCSFSPTTFSGSGGRTFVNCY